MKGPRDCLCGRAQSLAGRPPTTDCVEEPRDRRGTITPGRTWPSLSFRNRLKQLEVKRGSPRAPAFPAAAERTLAFCAGSAQDYQLAEEPCVIVSNEDRVRLVAVIADRNRPGKHVDRARIVLHRPTGWLWPRWRGGPGSAGRRCGGGDGASPKPDWKACCATRPGALAPRRCLGPSSRACSRQPAPSRPVPRPIGPGGRWPRPRASAWAQCRSASTWINCALGSPQFHQPRQYLL